MMNIVIVLHDKEEAAYFSNDLQNLLPDQEYYTFLLSINALINSKK
jgi:hypothetical protein